MKHISQPSHISRNEKILQITISAERTLLNTFTYTISAKRRNKNETHLATIPHLAERKNLTKHDKCRKGVAEKEPNEALTNAVRNREFGNFSARAFYELIFHL